MKQKARHAVLIDVPGLHVSGETLRRCIREIPGLDIVSAEHTVANWRDRDYLVAPSRDWPKGEGKATVMIATHPSFKPREILPHYQIKPHDAAANLGE